MSLEPCEFYKTKMFYSVNFQGALRATSECKDEEMKREREKMQRSNVKRLQSRF